MPAAFRSSPALQEGLAGDELVQLCGILNGTCNYILTPNRKRRSFFRRRVEEAQKLGFAEADPSEDVDGLDARAKLTILARTALRVAVNPSDISARSIRALEPWISITPSCSIAPSARFRAPKKLQTSFSPPSSRRWCTRSSPLASVEGGQNLVMSTGKFGGETVFAGHGAGGNPTAVAVVSDLIAIQRSRQINGAALYEDEAGGACSPGKRRLHFPPLFALYRKRRAGNHRLPRPDFLPLRHQH